MLAVQKRRQRSLLKKLVASYRNNILFVELYVGVPSSVKFWNGTLAPPAQTSTNLLILQKKAFKASCTAGVETQVRLVQASYFN